MMTIMIMIIMKYKNNDHDNLAKSYYSTPNNKSIINVSTRFNGQFVTLIFSELGGLNTSNLGRT